jgi:hypothetical protein
VEPRRKAIGEADIEQAIDQPISWIKSRNVAFSHQRDADSESVAPERKAVLGKRPCELRLDWLVHQIRIAADRERTSQRK